MFHDIPVPSGARRVADSSHQARLQPTGVAADFGGVLRGLRLHLPRLLFGLLLAAAILAGALIVLDLLV